MSTSTSTSGTQDDGVRWSHWSGGGRGYDCGMDRTHFRGAKGDAGPLDGPGFSAPHHRVERKYNVRAVGFTHPTTSPWRQNVVMRKCSWPQELHRIGRRAQNVVMRNSACCKEMTP